MHYLNLKPKLIKRFINHQHKWPAKEWNITLVGVYSPAFHLFADVDIRIVRRRRRWEVTYGQLLLTSVCWFLGGARRTESAVPRSQLEWGGASCTEHEQLGLPSCWERWRYQQICVCSATLQISLLQIVSGWGNSTWLGFWNDYWWQCPSGAAFINVPINFTCPALFCFH